MICECNKLNIETKGGGMPPLLCIFKSESEAKRDDAIESATTIMLLGARMGLSQLDARDKVYFHLFVFLN